MVMARLPQGPVLKVMDSGWTFGSPNVSVTVAGTTSVYVAFGSSPAEPVGVRIELLLNTVEHRREICV